MSRDGASERSFQRVVLLVGCVGLLLMLVVAALVGARWSPLLTVDRQTDNSVHHEAVGHPALMTVAKVLTEVGAPTVLLTVTFFVAVRLLLRQRRFAALYLAASVGGAYAISTGLKLLVHRPRPRFADHIFLVHPHGASFPSGHATGSAAFYLAFSLLGAPPLTRHQPRTARLVSVAVVIAVLVGLTRVLLGAHYPSDVLTGLLLGWSWTSLCTVMWHRAEGHHPADQDGRHAASSAATPRTGRL